MFSSNIVHRRINDFQHTFFSVITLWNSQSMYEVGNRTEQTRVAVYILSRHCEMSYLHQKLSTINHELLGNISVHPRTLSLLFNSDAHKKKIMYTLPTN